MGYVATTSYGFWPDYSGGSCTTVRDSVVEALGRYAYCYDIDAIEAEYRERIDEALPESIVLCGQEFIGPYCQRDFDWSRDESPREVIRRAVESVDDEVLAEIIERHDTSVPE